MRRAALIALLLAAAAAAGLWYADSRDVPRYVAAALLPAFLLELTLYFATASESVRRRLAALPRTRMAALTTAIAVPSYLLYAVPLGIARPLDVAALMAMAAAASFWFLVAGRSGWSDAGYLALMALPVLLHVFEAVYPSPTDRVPVQTLGVVMWYRTGIAAVLVLRRIENVGFGLLPSKAEWAIGARNFLLFVPVGLAAAIAVGFIDLSFAAVTSRRLLTGLVTFAGTLWFLAVAEEFFFRGLLQQLLARALGGAAAGLVAASAIFGLAHLGFRDFPNWKFAGIAFLAGLFYGRAYIQAGSIRAAMVAHALVNTLWRVFLA